MKTKGGLVKRMKPSLRGKQKGSILVEALLSIMILSVSISFITQSMTASLRAARGGSEYTQALFLLENKMFDLLRARFVTPGFNEEDEFPEPFENYRYVLSTEVSPDGTEQLNEVDLSVIWESGRKTKSVDIKTYFLNEPKEENQEEQ